MDLTAVQRLLEASSSFKLIALTKLSKGFQLTV